VAAEEGDARLEEGVVADAAAREESDPECDDGAGEEGARVEDCKETEERVMDGLVGVGAAVA